MEAVDVRLVFTFDEVMALAVVSAPLWGILCALIAQARSANVAAWAIAGMFFGPLAAILAAVWNGPPSMQEQPAEGQQRGESKDPFRRE